MGWPARFRSLLAQFSLRVILPLTAVMLLSIAAGVYVYQQTVTSLLVARDHQLAVLFAAQMSETVAGYARVLETLASTPDLRSDSTPARLAALENAADALQIFSAGVAIVDRGGSVSIVASPNGSPVGSTVTTQSYFRRLREELKPVFSDVLAGRDGGQPIILIAVPIVDDGGTFLGALLGGIALEETTLGNPIEGTRIGDGGIAYLVDGTGRIIFHPARENIGLDYTNRPFVKNVIAGESGGTLWSSQNAERVVIGYTPVSSTGWGLIVREPWDSVIAPVRAYGAWMALAALLTCGAVAYLLWQGVGRIAAPVRWLVDQTARLAAGESIGPGPAHGIDEIDVLERAFGQMATQIASYRAGLRRYVGAVTQSQEDERKRIARDLHDETIQSLLTVVRRLELIQASEQDPAQRARLNELQSLVTETMSGVRQISMDLRPLMLEDLGLIPALRALVRLAREGEGAVPHAKLDVCGQPVDLRAGRELALYRITQEALRNIRRHARATGIQAALTFDAQYVRLEISDDGQGFEVPESLTQLAHQGSFGLIGIQERVWSVDGSLSIQSTPGHGTSLRVSIPLGPA